ncbi:hypothetical protein BCR44DRAFT_40126 [Catenaria anguillulae PL171]|uniref:Large ribosomal subunit protein bL34m n=1 Tax=Catenaria anguillulae PL171 TaxID=765915 RepID=A0A1Y2HPB2_9FUNG|nr:hypothetical protein BCR44DRAFT_40126 [Catenaria anguillulae PL171]
MFARSILAAAAARRSMASVPMASPLVQSFASVRPPASSTVSPLLASAALAFRYPATAASASGPASSLLPVGARFMSKFGSEYQPSIIRRKRKWGFLARNKSRLGRKILARRVLKGRKWLSH